MKLLAFCVLALFGGIALARTAPAFARGPVTIPNDCVYVQSSYTAYGACMEPAEGCDDCCRHQDLTMEVQTCGGGNQFKSCTSFSNFFQAKVHYCPGVPPNNCQYAGTVTCNHFATAGLASGICPSTP